MIAEQSNDTVLRGAFRFADGGHVRASFGEDGAVNCCIRPA
jgi:hypothetical protein